ncbi:MAG: thiamine phosphate synthase [Bacteroidales bacterium]|nr:thiamine phosphate synthase [Bacteroidales bacterium]
MEAYGGFDIIVISSPEFIPGETQYYEELLNHGISRIHIRKPGVSRLDMADFLAHIPYRLRTYLSIHDHYNLAPEYKIGGIHLNQRNSLPPEWTGTLSKGYHSLEELYADNGCFLQQLDYSFLSPIYDSISKRGYRAAFTAEQLSGVREYNGIIALGGIYPENFRELYQTGFAGAALLGYIWSDYKSPEFHRLLESRLEKINEEVALLKSIPV